MCGVFGVINSGATESALNAAANALAHRGPDASGVHIDPLLDVGLVHRRLSIVDIEGGNQPLYDLKRNIVLVCNGEIYGSEIIRDQLRHEGYTFKTGSDSEVIINLYLKHGLECFEQLRGEFAFLLLDKRLKRLVAARDRFGVKPLFFAKTDSGGWCFSSEAKAMAAAGYKDLIVDLRNYETSDNDTLFRGVYHIPPATALVFDLSDSTFEALTYWYPDFPIDSEFDRRKSITQWAAELDRILTEAVHLRESGDVPVGVYLSGGIDSALIAAKLRRIADKPPVAFTVSFADLPEPFNEEAKARRIAEHLGLEHHVLKVDTSALWSNLEKALVHCEGPLRNLAPVGKYMLSALAAKHVKVVLGGEGADEVFLGYGRFNCKLDAARRVALQGRLAGFLSVLGEQIRRQLVASVLHRVPGETCGRIHAAECAGLAQQSRNETQTRDRSEVVRAQYAGLTRLNRVILTAYGDRMEMAHSLEGRVPFLDHRLFALARRIPVAHKIDGTREKLVLRKLAEGLVPKEVQIRAKWPFSTPTPSFQPGVCEPLDDLVARYMSKSAIRRAGLFKWFGVAMLRYIRRFPRFRDRADGLLFNVLCIQILHGSFNTKATAAVSRQS